MTTGEPIRLDYAVSGADQHRVVRELVARQPLIRWVRIAAVVIPPVMIAWSMSEGWSLGAAVFRNAFWIIVGALQLTLLVPLTAGRAVEAARQADPAWAERQTIVFDDTAIRMQSASSQTDIAWSEVDRAAERADMLLVWFRGTRVLYVPGHATRNSGVLPALRRMLQAKLGPRAELAVPREGEQA